MARARGYTEVKTPQLFDAELWRDLRALGQLRRQHVHAPPTTSARWALKPMNCPGHCVLYGDGAATPTASCRCASTSPALLHRKEPSGTLHGLLRVRQFAQDDAHIFCTEEQIQDEVAGCLDFGFEIYRLFGFEIALELSTRPEKRIGDDALWDHAEAALTRRARRPRARLPGQRGRRRLLRAEDRPAHDRLARALLAARHGPARLQPAGALRARATSAPTTPSTAR